MYLKEKAKSSKLKRFGYSLLASMGIYFAISSFLPASISVAVIIILLTGNFL